MIRKLHRWVGILAALLLIILSLSGATLSLFPMIEAISTPKDGQTQNVASLAALVQARHPGVEQIKRAPSGKITAWWFDNDRPGAALIDPNTGQDMGSADPSPVEQWLINLHRALFLDDMGRMVMACAAFAMVILTLMGMALLVRRVGGWRRFFVMQKGALGPRIHTGLAKVSAPFLILSAFSALWMVAATFSLLPTDEANPPYPQSLSGTLGFAVSDMQALQAMPLANLRSLTFPAAGDVAGVFSLTTAVGAGYIDQGTGQLVGWSDAGPLTKIWEWIYLLHTGQGAALWGLILGMSVLSVPVFAVTGIQMWLKARASRPKLRGMAQANVAQCVLLVGSEGGSTWGFAQHLATVLQGAGRSVHLAPLSSFVAPTYRRGQTIIVMTATWGDGAAPSSAGVALARLEKANPTAEMAVLGFGDKSFPAFCSFAHQFEELARAKGWRMLLPIGQIDRQSPQEFTRWGYALGRAMGLGLELNHQPTQSKFHSLTLISRRDYGQDMQAPAAILRFALPKTSPWQRLFGRLTAQGFGQFQAGDLLGIIPEGAQSARYYSLASGSKEGFLEITIRRHQGGLCSGQLIGLQEGDSVQAFLRPNPYFHADRRKTPLILIGAGTGIAPLVGFVRAQGTRRPVYLWFGTRHPETDLFYAQELNSWVNKGQLAGVTYAFSRAGPRQYVQDALRQDAATLQKLIGLGAKVMVCGGRDMAQAVQDTLREVLSPIGMTAAALKSEGRYAEDVY